MAEAALERMLCALERGQLVGTIELVHGIEVSDQYGRALLFQHGEGEKPVAAGRRAANLDRAQIDELAGPLASSMPILSHLTAGFSPTRHMELAAGQEGPSWQAAPRQHRDASQASANFRICRVHSN